MKSFKDALKPSKKKQFHNYGPRDSIISTVSRLSIGDITEDALTEWKNLPREIRQDPSLDPFKRKNDLLRGSN